MAAGTAQPRGVASPATNANAARGGSSPGSPESSPDLPGQGTDGVGGEAGGGGGNGGGAGSSEFAPLVVTRPRSLEFVLICGPSGLTIHPGGLRLSRTLLNSPMGDDWMENLWDRVRMMEREEPGIAVLPSVRFLVAPGGHDLYWSLRSHMMSEGLNWPVRIQVIESESAPGLSTSPRGGS